VQIVLKSGRASTAWSSSGSVQGYYWSGQAGSNVGMWHEKKGRENCTGCWWDELKEAANLDTGLDGNTNKMCLNILAAEFFFKF